MKIECNKAIEAAKFFLSLVNSDTGELMSNLKLQKLLYYAQGFNLAITDKKLFDDKICAWAYGPVVPTAYHAFKEHGSNPIPVENLNGDFSIFDETEKNIMEQVYSEYGQYSAWKLADMTHDEAPWKDTPLNSEITDDKLVDYFSQLVE
jgi:uncharacterized phage-associated protein